MDKVYPRLKVAKVTCHCGSAACKRIDGLPWKVYHVQYEGQLNPFKIFEAVDFEVVRDFAAKKSSKVAIWHKNGLAKMAAISIT